MKVAIFGQFYKTQQKPSLEVLFRALQDLEISVVIEPNYLDVLRQAYEVPKFIRPLDPFTRIRSEKIDALLTLGGDGTILTAATMIGDSRIPIMGINLGRLGFLASIEKRLIEKAIWLLSNGMFTLDERTLLQLESNIPLFGDTKYALNDFTISKRDSSSMITIKTYLNGEFLNKYWADGLIVATPTGSTGYSLSCGGPIIFPNSGNFVITPVAPHNLNVRPTVISDDSVISFEVDGRGDNFLCTLDSRHEVIGSGHQLAVRKCDFTISLIKLHDFTFLKTLRDKLGWGVDTRNN